GSASPSAPRASIRAAPPRPRRSASTAPGSRSRRRARGSSPTRIRSGCSCSPLEPPSRPFLVSLHRPVPLRFVRGPGLLGPKLAGDPCRVARHQSNPVGHYKVVVVVRDHLGSPDPAHACLRLVPPLGAQFFDQFRRRNVATVVET